MKDNGFKDISKIKQNGTLEFRLLLIGVKYWIGEYIKSIFRYT